MGTFVDAGLLRIGGCAGTKGHSGFADYLNNLVADCLGVGNRVATRLSASADFPVPQQLWYFGISTDSAARDLLLGEWKRWGCRACDLHTAPPNGTRAR
ncbi:hypothetical protein ACIBCN_43340 [Nocardia sp. NPDC051052]|uniref:hypothetical protein n=1 Tax=Nocardia sp. NPDC051052 TaxID=3364322 RepID=UPI00378C3C2E